MARLSKKATKRLISQELLVQINSPEVQTERRRNLALPCTDLIQSEEREKLREQIAAELYALNQMPETMIKLGQGGGRPTSGVFQQHQVFLIIGSPGSGKSRIAEMASERMHALIIDSDMAKAKLPEYDDGRGANRVHCESAELIVPLVIRRATENGDNIIYPLVGKTFDRLLALIDGFEQTGYTVHLILVHLDTESCHRRVLHRWRTTGRFIDPLYVLDKVADKPNRNYNKLRAMGRVPRYAKIVTDQPVGESPRIVEQSSETLDFHALFGS